MGWESVQLGQVCEIQKQQFRDGNLPYVGMEDIEGHTGKFLGSKTPRAVASSTFEFSNEHVLYGRLRPYLNKVLIPDFKGHCSSEIFPLKPNDKLTREYLFYWLSSDNIVVKINKTCTGARMPRGNVKEVLTFDILLPPLSEQKRIVALLDTVFADLEQTRAKTEQNLKNARELFDSYLQQVFSQKGEGWIDNQIGSICGFQNGFAFKSKDTVDTSNTQLIRMGNLYQNILSLDRKPAFYPNSFYDEHERYQLHKGDLIISLTGTVDKEDYGYTVEIPDTDRKLLLNQRIAKFINIDTTAINKRFLLRFLRSRVFLDKLYATARGTRQANLSTVTMSEMLISYPSINRQEELIRVIDELEKGVFNLEDIYKNKLSSIDELKKSILQKAFSGELTATA